MTSTRTKFLTARKLYSQCARRVETTIQAAPAFTARLSEQIVGLGVACDWVRRAAEMETISFLGDNLNDSSWQPSFVEMTRFGFAWYGINAIFSRKELLGLLGSCPDDSELERFRVLWNVAVARLPSLSSAVPSHEANLRSILAQSTTPRMPDIAKGTTVTTLRAVITKYVPPESRTKGRAAKAMQDAAATGNLSTLDLPILLYVFRNWAIHGNALHGSFGSKPRFLAYVESLSDILADVHIGTATALLPVL